jgi:hypothetical protein
MSKDFTRPDFQSDTFVSFNIPDSDQNNMINSGNQRDKLEFLSAGYEFNENSVASESLNMGGFRGGMFHLTITCLRNKPVTFFVLHR